MKPTQMDKVLDGLAAIIGHGSAEAASALFASSNAHVVYGHSAQEPILGSLDGNDDPLGSLDPPETPEMGKDNSHGR